MKVENPTFEEWVSLTDRAALGRISLVLQYAHEARTAENCFGLPELFDMTFGQVKAAQALRPGWGWPEYLAWLESAGVKNPKHKKVFELQRTALWLGEQLLAIDGMESKLSSPATSLEKAADLKPLEPFGVYGQYSELAGGDVTKMQAIEATPYSICFSELKYRHEIALYRRRYDALNRPTK